MLFRYRQVRVGRRGDGALLYRKRRESSLTSRVRGSQMWVPSATSHASWRPIHVPYLHLHMADPLQDGDIPIGTHGAECYRHTH
jgi:hypothetical protein